MMPAASFTRPFSLSILPGPVLGSCSWNSNTVGNYHIDPPFGSTDGDALVTSGLNRARLPAYHRADVGFKKAGRFFGIGDYELRLQAINVYSRRNVWFILNDPDDEVHRSNAAWLA